MGWAHGGARRRAPSKASGGVGGGDQGGEGAQILASPRREPDQGLLPPAR